MAWRHSSRTLSRLASRARAAPAAAAPSRLVLAVVATAVALGCGGSETAPVQDAAPLDTSKPSNVVLDGGGGIPEAPNGATRCPADACNYQTQEGCGLDGATANACWPMPDDEGGVRPTCMATGAAPAGAACAAWTDCAPGSLCVRGACRRLCCGGDYTACPNGEHCFTAVELMVGDAAVKSGAMVCMPVGGCDVLATGTCPSGQACTIVDPTGAVACLPEGKGTVGQDCPCVAGFLCVADACRRLCRAVEGGGEPSCPTMEGRCVHFDRDPPGVGECTP